MKRKLRVAVVFGGRSGEHEVSLVSASSVMKAMDRKKYDIIPIGITHEGKWLASGDPMSLLKSKKKGSSKKALLSLDPEKPFILTDRKKKLEIDVIFPVLHGTFGEDGTIQGLFEMIDIPYVGAGVMASSVGMDKGVMKSLFKHKRIPTPDFTVVKKTEWKKNEGDIIRAIEKEIGYPSFVKPVNLGSSVGISKAKNRKQLKQALNLGFRYDRKVIVEKGIHCREIECSVLGNEDPIASCVAEIVPKREFYDYKAKYTDGLADIIIPASLPRRVSERVRRLAVEAYKIIDCEGMARVDFFLEKGTNKVYVNEVNTIPGFTHLSCYPKLWEASGIPYARLIDRLIDLALKRHRKRKKIKTRL
jgi:D-alanine-D-alanine ligase